MKPAQFVSDAQPVAACPCCGAEWRPDLATFQRWIGKVGIRIRSAATADGCGWVVLGDGPHTERRHDTLAGATRDAMGRVVASIARRL